MSEQSISSKLKELLQQHPGEAFITPSGLALITLGGPEFNDVLIIQAPAGWNFNNMTDTELNKYIVAVTM